VPGHFGAVQLKCFRSNAGLPYISKFNPQLFRQKSRKKRLAAWQAVKVQIDDLQHSEINLRTIRNTTTVAATEFIWARVV